MEINCGSVELTTLEQSLLMCAGGEVSGLAALLVSALVILVKAQLLATTQECMKLLTNLPKMRGDDHTSFPNNAVDADNDDEDEEGEVGEEEEEEGEDRNPNGNKSGPIKGRDGGTVGGPHENGEDEDDEQEDLDEDDEDDDDDDGDNDEDENEDGEEGVEEEEEEALQPPKKRKK